MQSFFDRTTSLVVKAAPHTSETISWTPLAPSEQSLVGGTQAYGTFTPTSAFQTSDTSKAPPILSVKTESGSTCTSCCGLYLAVPPPLLVVLWIHLPNWGSSPYG